MMLGSRLKDDKSRVMTLTMYICRIIGQVGISNLFGYFTSLLQMVHGDGSVNSFTFFVVLNHYSGKL